MTVPAQEIIAARLADRYVAGRLAHAYLFSGPRGIGKYATALAVARRINCLQADRGMALCTCASCHKIDAGNHPDIFIVEKLKDKAFITIDQVRLLAERLGFRALEARVKVALVKEVDLMNDVAANALLKTLEEPQPDTLFILTSAVPDALPATIRSRCQAVRFPALSHEVLAQLLKSQYDMPSDDAAALAAFGQGSPGRALDLRTGFMDRRRMLLDIFFGSGSSEDLLKTVGTNRDSVREALGVVLMACRDALLIKSGASAYVVNRDRLVEIRRFAERHTLQDIDAQISRTVDAIRRVDGNQNTKVVLTVVREML